MSPNHDGDSPENHIPKLLSTTLEPSDKTPLRVTHWFATIGPFEIVVELTFPKPEASVPERYARTLPGKGVSLQKKKLAENVLVPMVAEQRLVPTANSQEEDGMPGLTKRA